MTRNTDSTDSEIPTGTGIAWAIQQINNHFNNLSGSGGMPVGDTLRASAKTIRRPEPTQPILSGGEASIPQDVLVGSTPTSHNHTPAGGLGSTALVGNSKPPSQKTLEQEFYRPGDFGADSSGFLTTPQGQLNEETGNVPWVQPRVVATIHYSGKIPLWEAEAKPPRYIIPAKIDDEPKSFTVNAVDWETGESPEFDNDIYD